MWVFQQKLKLLSRKLILWSREVVGNVFDQVNQWEAKMQNLEDLDLLHNNGLECKKLFWNKKLKSSGWKKMTATTNIFTPL